MANTKKIVLFASIGLLSVGVVGAGAGVSFAKYTSTKKASQSIGYQGKLTAKSIFLNANIWDIDDAIMYLYAYDSTNEATVNAWIQPSKVINPTINSTTFNLYVFQYDPDIYNHFNFVRVNPNGAHIGEWNWNDSPQTVWNATKAISFTSETTINYYCIEKWDNINDGDGYGHKTCGFTTNTLGLDGSNNLIFTGTHSDANLNS